MPALLGATFLVGAILGSLQVATPALALSRGAPALGGVLIAALSVGGITGALIYGGRRWASDPAARLLGLLCVIGVAATLLALGPPLAAVAVGLALVGLGLNPVFTTASLLIDRHSGPRAAEAFGWMSTAVGSGTALGQRSRRRAGAGRGCALRIPRGRCRRIRRGGHRGAGARPPGRVPADRSMSSTRLGPSVVLGYDRRDRAHRRPRGRPGDHGVRPRVENTPRLQHVGPFALLISEATKLRYLNYAIPDDGADPSPAQIDALIDGCSERPTGCRVSSFCHLWHQHSKAGLVARGFILEQRLPLMTCTPTAFVTSRFRPAFSSPSRTMTRPSARWRRCSMRCSRTRTRSRQHRRLVARRHRSRRPGRDRDRRCRRNPRRRRADRRSQPAVPRRSVASRWPVTPAPRNRRRDGRIARPAGVRLGSHHRLSRGGAGRRRCVPQRGVPSDVDERAHLDPGDSDA